MPRVVLADFGLARDTATGSRLTRTGVTLGTPAYMSPELATGQVSSLTPASDVWALGCVLYEMLAARPAFGGDSPAATVAAVIGGQRAPLSGVPAAAARLVDRCLQAQTGRRPATAAALVALADHVLAGGTVAPARRARWPLAVGATGMVAALAVAAWPGAARETPPPPAPSHGQEAERLAATARERQRTDPRAGIALWQQALRAAPQRDDWRVELALLQWSVNDIPSACTTWASVSPDSPHWPEARLHHALCLMFEALVADRDATAGMQLLRPLCERPDDTGRIARAAVAAGFSKWAEVLTELGDLPGWEAQTLRGHALTWLGRDDPAAVLRCFDEAVSQAPFIAALHVNRMNALLLGGDASGALAAFDQITALGADLPGAHFNRGVALHRLWRPQEALPAMERALAAIPDRSDWHAQRAKVLADLRRFDDALAAAQRALDLDATNRDAQRTRGALRADLGDPEGALADLTAVLDADPDDLFALHNRGIVHRKAGRLAEARADLDRALALDARFTDAWVERAAVRGMSHDAAGALADFEQALALRPDDPKIQLGVATGRMFAGDFERGAAGAIAVLARLPDYPAALLVQARCCAKLERWAEADAAARRLLQVEPNGPRVGPARQVLDYIARHRGR